MTEKNVDLAAKVELAALIAKLGNPASDYDAKLRKPWARPDRRPWLPFHC